MGDPAAAAAGVRLSSVITHITVTAPVKPVSVPQCRLRCPGLQSVRGMGSIPATVHEDNGYQVRMHMHNKQMIYDDDDDDDDDEYRMNL